MFHVSCHECRWMKRICRIWGTRNSVHWFVDHHTSLPLVVVETSPVKFPQCSNPCEAKTKICFATWLVPLLRLEVNGRRIEREKGREKWPDDLSKPETQATSMKPDFTNIPKYYTGGVQGDFFFLSRFTLCSAVKRVSWTRSNTSPRLLSIFSCCTFWWSSETCHTNIRSTHTSTQGTGMWVSLEQFLGVYCRWPTSSQQLLSKSQLRTKDVSDI